VTTAGRGEVVRLVELSVVDEGDSIIVGNPRSGVFVAVPPIGGVVIRALQAGASVAEATATAERFAGQPVDVGTFLDGLRGLGLVAGAAEAEGGPGRTAVLAAGRAMAMPVTPRQLPPAIPHFIGRQAELESLAEQAGRTGGAARSMVISVISGTAGVGKTTLAVRLAHDVAARFPDGQLYVNLRGFDPSRRPIQPSTAIRGFLRALAVPAQQIPARLDQQAGMYRSVLAGKRMLLVLDNARDEDQVRPLLPGSAGCLVIVTSRRQLTGLAAADGAHQLTLGLFTPGEGRELLARRLARQRVVAEPEAAAELVKMCALLPLALSVVAARAATLPTVPLAAQADELRDTQARLDAFDTGDVASSIRATFARSYLDLSQPARRMFRLLGLHPGPDVSVAAAASMAGVPADRARAALRELARFHLATEHVQGRFSCHDLLRAYATEQAIASDAEPERRAAVHRMLSHYLHTARLGAVLLHPARDEVTPDPPPAGVVPECLADHRQALAWYDAEHPALLASVELAAEARFDVHAWQLPWALVPFLFRRGHWHEWVTLQSSALAAAERLEDQNAQARALLDLGYAHTVRASHDEATHRLRQALRLFRQLGDQAGQARAYNAISMLLETEHRYAEALDYAKRSLDLYEAAGNPAAKANALGAVGWFHALVGDHQQALGCCGKAIDMHRELGNRHGEAHAWMVVGYALHRLGRHSEAITCHQRSLLLYQELGDLRHQADTLIELGEAQQADGDPQAAREGWQHALTILEELQHPDARRFRAKLDRVSSEPNEGRS
jgi:tetratricopeptide (TPR) repeat protein